MTPFHGTGPKNGAESPVLTETLRYVARQPILNLRGDVHGYELLFRSGPEALFRGDGDLATRTMLDNTLLFGQERLTGNLPAFLNCTAEALTEGLVNMLPPESAVLEILETIEPTQKVVDACRRLKASGYRLALDDFVWRPGFEPLLEIADYIKVDFLACNRWERQNLFRRLEGLAPQMLAEKIETQNDYQQACKEGFTLFQGYYFCRPKILKSHKIPANQLSQIAILALLRSESLNMRELSERLKEDASLTYRLLRLVNSPLYAMRQEVRSIDTALLVVGEDAFRRVAMLAITSEIGADQPLELLRMAFVRGRFCENGARLKHLDSTEQYLIGLISLMPAMLRTSMEHLTPALPLRAPVKEALQGSHNLESALLNWMEGHEQGDWATCDRIADELGIEQEDLVENYSEAVLWAEKALSAAG